MDAVSNTTLAGTSTRVSSDSAVETTDYETFLKMLTTQMKNQDPLNPVEASDYAAQLAAFSSVEQQVLTNDLLKSIEGRFSSDGMSQLANWVGMDALSRSPAFFDGAPVAFRADVNPLADRTDIVVQDQSGQEVFRGAIENDGQLKEWAGTTSTGGVAEQGFYTLSVESFSNNVSLGSSDVPTYARVIEAQVADSGVNLILEGGGTVASEEVEALR